VEDVLSERRDDNQKKHILEKIMISKDYDLKSFVDAIDDRDYLEVMYLAEKEATEAERQYHRLSGRDRYRKRRSDPTWRH
jgi:hypothetical protein